MPYSTHKSRLLPVEERKRSMKKSIKTVLLSLVVVGALAGCDFGNQPSNTSSSSSSESSTSLTSSSTSETSTSSSSSSSTSSIAVKTNIVLTAEKTRVEVFEQLTINSNVEGVTYSTSEGASVFNGLFSATKEGTYVVTAHKEGDFSDGTITIEVFKKIDIVIPAEKENGVDVNERVTLICNVEGVTYTTTEGASVVNGVFTATKEGTYVVTGHKDGNYIDGTVTITVAFKKTAAKIKGILKAMKEGQNFTITASNLLGTNKIYRTKDYFFDSQSNEGQALFTNIIQDTQFDKVAHYIKLVNNELIIGNDVLYQT